MMPLPFSSSVGVNESWVNVETSGGFVATGHQARARKKQR